MNFLWLSAEAAKQLVHELSCRFPAHHLMEALGLVYPQYWLTEDCKENFDKHMVVIKSHYCEPKTTHTHRGRPTRKSRKRQELAVVSGVDSNAQVRFTRMRFVFLEIHMVFSGLSGLTVGLCTHGRS